MKNDSKILALLIEQKELQEALDSAQLKVLGCQDQLDGILDPKMPLVTSPEAAKNAAAAWRNVRFWRAEINRLNLKWSMCTAALECES